MKLEGAESFGGVDEPMATTQETAEGATISIGQARLSEFRVEGLFGVEGEIVVQFPNAPDSTRSPSVLIISGRNGTGKTTILRMIAGMLKLDFNEFRRIPFTRASLSLSTGGPLEVIWDAAKKSQPLYVTYGGHAVDLALNREETKYTAEQQAAIEAFREEALPIFGAVNYVLLQVNRSFDGKRSPSSDRAYQQWLREIGRLNERRVLDATLSEKVRDFLREAQLDYRRYFRAEELELLPRILNRLRVSRPASKSSELLTRLQSIRDQVPLMQRYGLQTDDDDLTSLQGVLSDPKFQTTQDISLIETYVEIQEGIQEQRSLIAKRLTEFEAIMDEFLFDKEIRIDARRGLSIQTKLKNLSEDDLSSGEYHFLYMMVSALLCRRLGSVIAIDEPELSLHISWQRKLVSALTRCAAGASPLFLFATHSLAIQAEHADKVVALSAIDR